MPLHRSSAQWRISHGNGAGANGNFSSEDGGGCTAFSKAKSEQTTTLSVGNKNLREVLVAFIPNFDPKKRYKVSGEFDAENRVMYYDMTTAVESALRVSKE